MVKWYSLFSHTGKETESLWRLLSGKAELDVVLTTNGGYRGELPRVIGGSGASINQWLTTPGNVVPGSIVTLNGYMRIVPAEVLEYLSSINCKVFNIHPAPIWLYPELRGKDPQERLWEGLQDGRYQYVGLVIHEVDPGLDTGKIVHWKMELPVNFSTKAEMYQLLHEVGTKAWVEFFEEEMWRDGQNC